MNLDAIGKNIATIRKANHLTQVELASRLNVTPQAVSKWENGVNLPETSLLVALSQLFQVTIDELLMNDPYKGNRIDG
ncbi:MAG: helix-turn-helix transcriptional regulator [Clostridia bacterium]|nr:helix-turn-helix transcriptional regulator [Clostridia bacterium]